MEVKNNLKLCGILNFVLAAIDVVYMCVSHYNLYLFINTTILIFVGAILYQLASKNEREIKRKKWILILFGIIMMPFNTVAAVISLITLDKVENNNYGINAPPEEEKSVIDSETKRLDIVLKIGVGMVLLSGIIFSTTNWNIIPDIAKTLLILLIGIIFLALSWITNNFVKVLPSMKMYYLLGVIFLWLSYFSLGWYGIIEKVLTLNEKFVYIFFSSCGLLGSVLLYISYIIFKEEVLNVLTIITTITSLVLLSLYFEIGYEFIFLAISFGLLILFILNKDNKIFRNILSVLMYINIFLIPFFCMQKVIIVSFLLVIISLVFLFMKLNDKDGIVNAIFMLYIVLLMIGSITFKNLDYIGIYMAEGIYVAILFFIILKNKFESIKKFSFTFSILSIFIVFIIYIIKILDISNGLVNSFVNSNYEIKNVVLSFYNSLILLLLFIIFQIKYRKNEVINNICYVFIIPSLVSFMYFVCLLNWIQIMVLLFIIFVLIQYFLKLNYLVYFNGILMLLVSVLILNTPDLFSCLFLLLGSWGYYLTITKNKYFKGAIYIFNLLIICICFLNNIPDITSISYEICTIIAMILLFLIAVIFRRQKFNLLSSLFFIIIPFQCLIDSMNFDKVLNLLFMSILILYLTFIICYKIVSRKNNKLIILLISSLLVLNMNVFMGDLVLSIFVMILSIVLILIGLKDDDYKSLFVIGIIYLLFDIFYQIKDYISQIPFWFYLLLCGLILIGIVTYKQIKRK